MLTNEEAKYLLGLDKVLSDPNQIVDLGNKKNRLHLHSHEDSEYNFCALEMKIDKNKLIKTSVFFILKSFYFPNITFNRKVIVT